MNRISNVLALGALAGLCAVSLGACATHDSTRTETHMSETGSGDKMSGVDAFRQSDFKTAEDKFSDEHRAEPGNPYAQFNLADTYLATGRQAEAIVLYRDVAVSGRGVQPGRLYEPHKDGATLQDAACDHLKLLSVQDDNCPA